MFVRVRSSALLGVAALPVDVEVDAASGFPRSLLVGLAGGAVQESLVRVQAAVRNLGYRLPSKRITVNLAPADLRKEGTGFDLPIALALLAACGLVPVEPLATLHVCGELSLSGEVRPVRGVLPMAVAALRDRARAFLAPSGNALEAAAVEGLAVRSVRHLAEMSA